MTTHQDKDSMTKKHELCPVSVGTVGRSGFVNYSPCNRPVKFIVENTNVRGKIEKQIVCGVHKNSIEKWAARVKRRIDFDPQLKVVTLNATKQPKP